MKPALAEAMSRSGLAAIAKYVMRDKQNLGCPRVRDGVIALERMHFADEVRPAEEVAPERRPSWTRASPRWRSSWCSA
jgi:non-homologous end joining protein Ku